MRLLKMAQQGQLRSQVGEKQLITMMEQIAEQQKNAGKITFARRKVAGWSDTEDDDDDSDLM
jgi:DNA-binding TFAR19-related protein (PDSD5 family)